MGIMNMLADRGDWELKWDPESKLEVDQVRKTFDHNVKDKGFAAFKMGKRGKRGEQLHTFDPLAERIVLVPPISGG